MLKKFLKKLNEDQKNALSLLQEEGNVFVTGVAGSGKSFLIKEFLKDKKTSKFPVLASTGAAAILVGGRTFHSFFGLGIFEGGIEETIRRAIKNERIVDRIRKVEGVVIDEISMISGPTLSAAESIARLARNDQRPWGGMKVVAVGDFAQLPPVDRNEKTKKWAFLDYVWEFSDFKPAILNKTMRTDDEDFIRILNFVRKGIVNQEVSEFLESRKIHVDDDFPATRLFSRRDEAEKYNVRILNTIAGETKIFETKYTIKDKENEMTIIERVKTQFPIPFELKLKKDALVMIRQNDIEGTYVNGTIGIVRNISNEFLTVELPDGDEVQLEKSIFTMLDAEGEVFAKAENFPVNLAYATTIHKSQGMTLDSSVLDLKRLWEPGHAYVALSRVKKGSSLYVKDWSGYSIKADKDVIKFHEKIMKV